VSTPKRRPRPNLLSVESLEGRELLSADGAPAVFSGLIAIQAGSNATTARAVLAGTTIHAQVGQPFVAVVGTVRNFAAVADAYRLKGSIDWGDGSVSPATIVRQSDGSLTVIGNHLYAAAGSDLVQVTVTAYPPAGSLAPVRLLGTFRSKAEVFTPNGGVTLGATAGVSFTANLGSFRTTASTSKAIAIIDWGDGTFSRGTILAVPTAGPLAGGFFVVMGSHTYVAVGSYVAHISVLSDEPLSPVASTSDVSPLAVIDSVIDVLPPLPSAV